MKRTTTFMYGIIVGLLLGWWIVPRSTGIPVDIFRRALLGCSRQPTVCAAATLKYFPSDDN